jgi:hypothetical protein
MTSFVVDAHRGRVISVGAKALRPAVVWGNTHTIVIRLGRAWDSMPRDDSMDTMTAGGPCGELPKAFFDAMVHFGFEVCLESTQRCL